MKFPKVFLSLIKSNKVFTIILFIAALLRFIGTNPGHDQYHPDEGISYAQGIYIILERTLDAHGYPLAYAYPTLVPLINAIFDFLLFIPGSFFIYFLHHPRIFLFDVFHWGEIAKQLDLVLWTDVFGEKMFNVLHWGRYVTALFGLGVVLLTYKLAKIAFNRKVALLSALFVTFNYRQVLNSHIGLPDMYNCFFFLLSLLFSLRLLRDPRFKNYLLAGVFAGLSFSTKFQTFAFIPLALAYLDILFRGGRKDFLKKLVDKKILFSVLMVILVPIFLNPFHILHWQMTYQQLKDVSAKYSFGKNQLNLYPYSYLFNIGIGQFLSIFAVLGQLLLLKKEFKLGFWFFAPTAVIFYVFTYYSNGGFYTRNFISITPVLLIFSAYFLYHFFLYLETKVNYLIFLVITLGILLISLAGSARDSIINSYYYSLAWGYDTMLKKNELILPDKIIIASHPFNPISKVKSYKRIDFETATSYSFAEFKEQGAQYAYVNMDIAGNQFYGWMAQSFSSNAPHWNKPVNIFNNTFWGLSINEMMQYTIVDTYKPWQASDASLFITKIPDLEKGMQFQTILQYRFDQNLESWYVQNPEDSDQLTYLHDANQGNSHQGSIKSNIGTSLNGVKRISSPLFKIKPGHSYRISGYLKSDQNIPMDQRNGFLRADFYPGISGGVSARYFGKRWKKYSFDVLAPNNSQTMQISFQIADSSAHPFWVDDISVEESSQPAGNLDSYPIPFDFYKDLLYPNSHGNL